MHEEVVDLREPTLVKIYSVVEKITEKGFSYLIVEVSPIKGDLLYEPVALTVRSEHTPEEQVDLFLTLKDVVASEYPYLWVLEIARIGDMPVCVLADHNVWGAVRKALQDSQKKQVRSFGFLAFVGGVLLGVAAGFFLSRRVTSL